MLQYVICGVLISEVLRLMALSDPANNPVKYTAPPPVIASKTVRSLVDMTMKQAQFLIIKSIVNHKMHFTAQNYELI